MPSFFKFSSSFLFHNEISSAMACYGLWLIRHLIALISCHSLLHLVCSSYTGLLGCVPASGASHLLWFLYNSLFSNISIQRIPKIFRLLSNAAFPVRVSPPPHTSIPAHSTPAPCIFLHSLFLLQPFPSVYLTQVLCSLLCLLYIVFPFATTDSMKIRNFIHLACFCNQNSTQHIRPNKHLLSE